MSASPLSIQYTPRAIISDTDPSVVKAQSCLSEMGRRAARVNGKPLRATVEVLDTDVPWAGIVEEPHRRQGSSMFVTRGLVRRLGTEELIAVMGHEWGHVVDKRRAVVWAVRCTALAGSVGVNLMALSLLTAAPGFSGSWNNLVGILLATVVLMAFGLAWENRANQAQELACDRFAAKLVGPRTMIGTLRRVETLMGSPSAITSAQAKAWRWRSPTHPSVRSRVINIARHRHRLKPIG